MANPYPRRGLKYGGNGVSAVRWLMAHVGYPLLALASATVLLVLTMRIANRSSYVALVVATMLVAVTSAIKAYESERPQPSPLRITPSGLGVRLDRDRWWFPGKYHLMPWDAISSISASDAVHPGQRRSLVIGVAEADRDSAVALPGGAHESLRMPGTVTIPDVVDEDLNLAIRHYSWYLHSVVTAPGRDAEQQD